MVLAHAYYPYEFGDFGGDVHFDEDEDWQANATQHRQVSMSIRRTNIKVTIADLVPAVKQWARGGA